MAKAKKFVPNEDVASFFTQMKPDTPIMTSAEKSYFKGLKKRGYSEAQIRQGIEKAGYKVGPDFFVVKTKEQLAAEKAARELKKKQAGTPQPEALRAQYAQPQVR